jgi:molybdate transport system regulatory protein
VRAPPRWRSRSGWERSGCVRSWQLRLLRADDIALGPGKADLLDAIGRTGSISAAARELGMSYRRAWLLVDTMNRNFRAPLVAASAGGSRGGGAGLTDDGARVLALYRAMQDKAEAALREDWKKLRTLLAPGG